MLEIFYKQMNKDFRFHFVSFDWIPQIIPLTDDEFWGIYCSGGEI